MLMQGNTAFENVEATSKLGCDQPLASVFQMSATETVEAGEAICWEGDAAKHLFQIVEGVVRLHRIIGEGRRVITAFQFAGDVVGAFLQGDLLFTAEAVTDCKIRRVSRKTFHDEVSRSDALRPAYINLLCKETAAAHDQMVLLSKKNAEERLCSFILKLALRSSSQLKKGLLRLPMNRQDIADYLGLTIETVSRTISKLAAKNIVIPEGRHDLRIVSQSRLVQLSGNSDDFSEKTCHRGSVH
ncbi:helix-turn-helix domain-containing protein [Rhizobium sp. IBUN]|uniref:Crp/Fnr family transcriptional regulator n=1 Tax=Rhizobium sp. IBUN TaxID=1042326 RepID=UPI0004148C9A|nr:helix-turn-helix domain-containing protein [Rhizobium sp. IBUN]